MSDEKDEVEPPVGDPARKEWLRRRFMEPYSRKYIRMLDQVLIRATCRKVDMYGTEPKDTDEEIWEGEIMGMGHDLLFPAVVTSSSVSSCSGFRYPTAKTLPELLRTTADLIERAEAITKREVERAEKGEHKMLDALLEKQPMAPEWLELANRQVELGNWILKDGVYSRSPDRDHHCYAVVPDSHGPVWCDRCGRMLQHNQLLSFDEGVKMATFTKKPRR